MREFPSGPEGLISHQKAGYMGATLPSLSMKFPLATRGGPYMGDCPQGFGFDFGFDLGFTSPTGGSGDEVPQGFDFGDRSKS